LLPRTATVSSIRAQPAGRARIWGRPAAQAAQLPSTTSGGSSTISPANASASCKSKRSEKSASRCATSDRIATKKRAPRFRKEPWRSSFCLGHPTRCPNGVLGRRRPARTGGTRAAPLSRRRGNPVRRNRVVRSASRDVAWPSVFGNHGDQLPCCAPQPRPTRRRASAGNVGLVGEQAPGVRAVRVTARPRGSRRR
jgi:hypothetical protein